MTTTLVVNETVTLFQRRGAVDAAFTFLDSMRGQEAAEVIHPSAGQVERAWKEFVARAASGATAVDCVSFVVMRDLGIRRAYTFDKHFRAAGFQILA